MVLESVRPEAALPWIKSIQNEEKRKPIERGTMMSWESEDPKGDAEWKKTWKPSGPTI